VPCPIRRRPEEDWETDLETLLQHPLFFLPLPFSHTAALNLLPTLRLFPYLFLSLNLLGCRENVGAASWGATNGLHYLLLKKDIFLNSFNLHYDYSSLQEISVLGLLVSHDQSKLGERNKTASPKLI
jgi:hypothetical protein